MIGQWELRVVTYELKRQEAWTVESVLQAASYNEFAHESWLIVPSGDDGDDDSADYFGKGIVTKAGNFGVALGPSTQRKERTETRARTRLAPLLSRQHDWLDLFDRTNRPREKANGDRRQHRWSRDKATLVVTSRCCLRSPFAFSLVDSFIKRSSQSCCRREQRDASRVRGHVFL